MFKRLAGLSLLSLLLLAVHFSLMGFLGQPVAPVLAAGEICFATPDNGTTVYSSTDASAVRDAIGVATAGATVKVAGYCAGAVAQNGTNQVALITQSLTLAGGYTTTNWTTPDVVNNATTLDALSGGRVLSITAAATLQGFTATNGYVNAGGADENGGGIYATSALTLTDMHVYSNALVGTGGFQFGGGVSVEGAAQITNSWFDKNQTRTQGGGGYFRSTATISGSRFTNNDTSNALNNSGGGAYFLNAATLTNTLFTTNTTFGSGGGAYFSGSPTTLANLTLANNTAGGGGGANFAGDATVINTLFLNNIANSTVGGAATIFTNVAFTNTAFIGNQTAGDGGAVFLTGNRDSSFVNTLFDRNSATGRGTALYGSIVRTAELVHVTIVSPTLASNQAIYVGNATNAVYITNTIIASHTVGIRRAGGTVAENYNLFSDVTTPYSGTISSGGNSITGTAAFYDTTAYTLTAGSAAVDAGTDAGVTSDYFGTSRPQGDDPDIGYAEFAIQHLYLPLIFKN